MAEDSEPYPIKLPHPSEVTAVPMIDRAVRRHYQLVQVHRVILATSACGELSRGVPVAIKLPIVARQKRIVLIID